MEFVIQKTIIKLQTIYFLLYGLFKFHWENFTVPISSYIFHTHTHTHTLSVGPLLNATGFEGHAKTQPHRHTCYTVCMYKLHNKAYTTILTAVWSLTWFVNYWWLGYKMAVLKICINILLACQEKQIYSHSTSCCVLNLFVDRQCWTRYNSYEECQHIILMISSTEIGKPHNR
jgi:hypothetical protein